MCGDYKTLAARRLRLTVATFDVTNPGDLGRAFGTMTKALPDEVIE